MTLTILLAAALSACAVKPRHDAAGWRSVTGIDPASVESFRVSGRLAVSDGSDGGSAGFLWTQRGDAYEFELRQPVSQRTWRLRGDARGAVLEGGDDGPRRGESAEALLHKVLGWRVPVAALRHWVRGHPHPWVRGAPGHGPATGSERDAAFRLTVLEQDGWRIEYREWMNEGSWPARIVATRPPYSVRLSIRQWWIADE